MTLQVHLISSFPEYESVRQYLLVVDGRQLSELEEMADAIRHYDEKKEPPINWSNPDRWLTELDDSVGSDLARTLWSQSKGNTNPRYTYYLGHLIREYGLLDTSSDMIRITDAGNEFINEPNGAMIQKIDREQGMIPILTTALVKGKSKSDVFEKPFGEFCEHTIGKIPKSLYNYLMTRINNLIKRGYFIRVGNFYDISTNGRHYLEKLDPENKLSRITDIANRDNDETKQRLSKMLSEMNAFNFEAIVAQLFVKMDYKDVEDRQPTNDGGIDVIATKNFGFGDEQVLIQVKRYKNKIKREVISQLRDDMKAFDHATRGIVVTTSDFTDGAIERANESGEVPIDLINGENLIDLMIEYEVAIKKHPITYLSLHNNALIDAVNEYRSYENYDNDSQSEQS